MYATDVTRLSRTLPAPARSFILAKHPSYSVRSTFQRDSMTFLPPKVLPSSPPNIPLHTNSFHDSFIPFPLDWTA